MLTLLLMALAAGPLTDAVERGISESLARARIRELLGGRVPVCDKPVWKL